MEYAWISLSSTTMMVFARTPPGLQFVYFDAKLRLKERGIPSPEGFRRAGRKPFYGRGALGQRPVASMRRAASMGIAPGSSSKASQLQGRSRSGQKCPDAGQTQTERERQSPPSGGTSELCRFFMCRTMITAQLSAKSTKPAMTQHDETKIRSGERNPMGSGRFPRDRSC